MATPIEQQIAGWNVHRVGEWLAACGLQELVAPFKENDIDGEILLTLSEEDLQATFNISSLGFRRKVLKRMKELLGKGVEGKAVSPIASMGFGFDSPVPRSQTLLAIPQPPAPTIPSSSSPSVSKVLSKLVSAPKRQRKLDAEKLEKNSRTIQVCNGGDKDVMLKLTVISEPFPDDPITYKTGSRQGESCEKTSFWTEDGNKTRTKITFLFDGCHEFANQLTPHKAYYIGNLTAKTTAEEYVSAKIEFTAYDYALVRNPYFDSILIITLNVVFAYVWVLAQVEDVPEKFALHSGGVMQVPYVKLQALNEQPLATQVNVKCIVWSVGIVEYNNVAQKNMLNVVLAEHAPQTQDEENTEPVRGCRAELTLWDKIADKFSREIADLGGIVVGRAVAAFNVSVKTFMLRAALSSVNATFLKLGDDEPWRQDAHERNFPWVVFAESGPGRQSTLEEKPLWAFEDGNGPRTYQAKVKIADLTVTRYEGCGNCNKKVRKVFAENGDWFCPKCDAFIEEAKIVTQASCKLSTTDVQNKSIKASAFDQAAQTLHQSNEQQEVASAEFIAEIKIDVNPIFGNSAVIKSIKKA